MASWGSLLAVGLALAACSEAQMPQLHGETRVQQIRPTDGTGWNGNGYGSGVTVKQFDSPGGKYRLHYVESGKHAVPSTDADTDKVPDFVEQFAKTFDEVYAKEVTGLGFRPPLDDSKYNDNRGYGGDSRFDVYLQNQPSGADGYVVTEACTSDAVKRCAGYMVVENDFVGFSYATPQDGMKVLASHEFFHTVQNAYRSNMARTFSEATAVWATEQVFPEQKDFEHFIPYFFKQAERSLDHALGGAADAFPYALGIWPQFLSEKFGTKVIPAVMEAMSEKGTAQNDLDAIDLVLKRDHKSDLATAFTEFALWNYFTGTRAKSSGTYKKANDYAMVTVKDQGSALPMRISGEIAYLGSLYHKVAAKQGQQVTVVVERPQPMLAVHLITGSGAQQKVASLAPPKAGDSSSRSVSIVSQGEVAIVMASTARKDRHLPYSLAVTAKAAAVQTDSGLGSDAGTTPGGDAGPLDPGDEGGCSVAGAGAVGGGWLLALVALLVGIRRRTSSLALVLAGSIALAGAAGCSDDDPVSNGGADAGLDSSADIAVDVGPDKSIKPDSSGGLAVGQFKEYVANASGVVSGSVPASYGEEYLVLLISTNEAPRTAHKYTAKLTGSANTMEPEPLPPPLPAPRLPARHCTFTDRVSRILATKPKDLRSPPAHQFLTQPPKVGETRMFNIKESGTVQSVKAEALHVDSTSAIWIDRDSTPKATITAAEVAELAKGFSDIIVPRERIYYGEESDINSDGRIALLLSPLVTKSAMAYFSPCDLLDATKVTYCAGNNPMEILYMSPPSSLKPPYNTAKALLETVAHELQHAIYFYRKYIKNNLTAEVENPYITEGLSHMAQDISGYQAGNLYVVMSTLRGSNYLSVPNLTHKSISQYVSGSTPGGLSLDGLFRGGDYLLLRYLFDQSGGESMDASGKPVDKGGIKWLRSFVDSPKLGVANVTGSANLTSAQIAKQFWTAMALSNRGSGGKPINSNPLYNFQPTAVDPLTGRQRGCNLFASLHGMSMTGPTLQGFELADGSIYAGGAELLRAAVGSSHRTFGFTINSVTEAKLVVRLIRLK